MEFSIKATLKRNLTSEEISNLINSLIYHKGQWREEYYNMLDFVEINQATSDVTPNTQPIYESVITHTSGSDEIANIFENELKALASTDLRIIDPYFFAGVPSHNPEEEETLCQLLAKIINKFPNVKNVSIITDERHTNENFKSNIVKLLKDNNRIVKWANTTEFHDRFWYLGQKSGIVVGTSFNGLGKRISLITKLNEKDLSDIINEVNQLNLNYTIL